MTGNRRLPPRCRCRAKSNRRTTVSKKKSKLCFSGEQNRAHSILTGNQELQQYCRERFKTVLVPGQIEKDASLPLEMRRTKPYGYSLFNLDAMTAIGQILSTPADNLWAFETADGRGVRKAVAFMAPYLRDKKSWPLKPDVMYDAD